MSLFKLYLLLTILPHLQIFCRVVGLFVIICLFGCLFQYGESEEKTKAALKVGKMSLIMLTISGLLLLVIPAQNEILKIYGIHYVTSNENIKNLPDNAARYLNQELTKYIKTSEEK